ncbi:hypothetical protein OROMI_028972 [Orobanche minor]
MSYLNHFWKGLPSLREAIIKDTVFKDKSVIEDRVSESDESLDDHEADIFSGLTSTEDRVSLTSLPPLPWFPKVLHDQINLLKQRASEENLPKHRASEENLLKQKASEENLLKHRASEENLLKQRASEEAKEEERMKASIISLSKDKWSNSCCVHVRTEPLIEVLSVSLTKEIDLCSHNNEEPLELYGNIYVHDGINKCFIYERGEEDDPEIIPLGGSTLSLTGPDDFISMDSPNISICIDLRDKVTGKTIIDGSAQLFKTIDTPEQHHHFEQFRIATICSTLCSAHVKYLALTFGVLCRVKVALFKQQVGSETNKEEELRVYGSICAEYNLCLSERSCIINLLEIEKDGDDCGWVTWESPIILARSVVAVPAYTPLKIHIDLMNHADNQPIVRGSCVFEPENYDDSWEIIPGQNGLSARVTVDWREPFMIDDPQRSFMLSLPARTKHFNYFLVFVLCIFVRLFFLRFNMVLNAPDSLDISARSMVEVFSIFIGRPNDEKLSLHGMVNFRGCHGLVNIFKRDRNDPYVLPRGCNLLLLEGPKDALVPADSFWLSVDLEDAENNVSIKGFACSSYNMDQAEEHWLCRLLCSVVKGANHRGFAAIHYSIFLDAFKARLKVHFFFKGEQFSGSSRIYGSVVASYGEYGCRTSYERLYHKTLLFERPEGNPYEKPCKDFDVELSRSVVSVPYDSFLEIEVDLRCSMSTSFYRRVKEMSVIHIGSKSVVVQGDQVEIRIGVEWC